MGKTNREYCKSYREKNKAAYQKNDRERKKFKRDTLKYLEPEKYEVKKKQERERLRLYRLRKKEEARAEKERQALEQQKTPETEGLVSFKNIQSFSRSVKRAENALPFSPTKKKEVINGLAKRYQLRIKLAENRGRKAYALNEEQLDWMKETLERPDLTYITPGRKDNVYIGKDSNGVKQYIQKRYLLWTLRDLLDILNGN